MAEIIDKKQIVMIIGKIDKEKELSIVNIIDKNGMTNPKVGILVTFYPGKLGFIQDNISEIYRNIDEMVDKSGAGPVLHIIELLGDIDNVDIEKCKKVYDDHLILPQQYFKKFCLLFPAYCWCQDKVKTKKGRDTTYGRRMIIEAAKAIIDKKVSPEVAEFMFTEEYVQENVR